MASGIVPTPGENGFGAKNKLTAGQIAFLVKEKTGWRGGEAVKAIAIALAESRGDAYAHNQLWPDDSRGLWQVNLEGDLANRKDVAKSVREEPNLLFRPDVNAQNAYSIYQASAGGSFRPWSVFTSGKYRIYMGRARDAWADPTFMTPSDMAVGNDRGGIDRDIPDIDPIGDATDRIGDIASTVAKIDDAFQFATDPGNWRRVGMFVGGGALIITGIVMMFGPEMVKAGYKVASYAPQAKAMRGQ